jgi:hypothetical protein
MQFGGSLLGACCVQLVEQPELQLVSQVVLALAVHSCSQLTYSFAAHAVCTVSLVHSVMHSSFFLYSHLASPETKMPPQASKLACAGALLASHANVAASDATFKMSLRVMWTPREMSAQTR